MREELLLRLIDAANEGTAPIFDIAVMDASGISSARPSPSCYANDSYSVAKAFVASAALILFDRGVISPETKIFSLLSRFFPKGYDKKWEDVTIAQCITHTTGIGGGFLDIDAEDQRTFGDDWLEYSFLQPLDYLPGEHYAYSDGAYYILSRAIEEASGVEASEFIADNITSPLEFRDCAWSKCPKHHAVGATGFYASAEDVVKLGWLFANGGRYKDRQIISEGMIKTALDMGYGLTPQNNSTTLFSKGGMFGQVVMASPIHKCAIAWHSFTDRSVNLLSKTVVEILH